MKQGVKERFLRFAEPITESGCWIWMGALFNTGYGIFNDGKKNVSAHRAAYRLFKGEIPEDKCVCHTCDVRCCVNPNHLWLGTHQDNDDDKVRKGRQAKGKRHGMYGRALRGSDGGNSKLHEDDVRAIRASSATRTALARVYGVTIACISLIVHRKTWQHI